MTVLSFDQSWLKASRVSKEYVRPRTGERTLALSEISLSIEEGQFVSLVGPSGCGKTTFLKILNGLVTPTSGEISLHGKNLNETEVSDRAMVFQEASLFPWFTVARNVGYGLECRGMSKGEAHQAAIPFVNMVGLSGFEDHYPHELSGGMQQRVNLARALAVNPDLLLMDEPFAALDAQTRESMQAELLRVWERTRKTVVFITHQIDEAIYLSDRVIVLSARPGRIVDELSINLGRPRSLSIKRSPDFRAFEDRIWSHIHHPNVEDI